MADHNNFSTEESFRRRVQHKLAGRMLEQIDPDHVYTESGSKFSKIDPKIKAEFEEQYGKYKPKASAFSITNILWLISSIAMFHFTDFYMVLRFDPNINRLWFNIGAILITINVCVGIFLICWLSFVKKIPSDQWEKLYPAAIPVATTCFLCGSLCLNVGLWPVWGLFTPVVLFTIFMGIIVVVAMFG